MPRPTPDAYLCALCIKADRTYDNHPGQMHSPGICDCTCRNT